MFDLKESIRVATVNRGRTLKYELILEEAQKNVNMSGDALKFLSLTLEWRN
jgi:hypothetical protein